MKQKILLILIFLGIILVSGCVQQLSEPKVMQSGLHYDGSMNAVSFDIPTVTEKARNEGYAIRILTSPAGCKNPVPGGGCKGGDDIPPEYEYINVEQGNSYSMEEAMNKYPKRIGFKGTGKDEDINIYVSANDYWWIVSSSTTLDKWSVKFVPNKEMQTVDAEQIISQELVNIGVTSNNVGMVFAKGYVPPQLAN